MLGPVIEGTLITLAPIEREHLENYCRWSRDPRGVRYLPRQFPLTMDDEQRFYERVSTSREDVVWAILREGRHIGSTGLHGIDWQHRKATSGTWIGETAEHGKGFGREAMALRTAYAFNELGLNKVLTEIIELNEASRRAALRAGYRECGRFRRHLFREGTWWDVWLGEVLRDEWEAAQHTR
jgi:RimJ/RimL family protein N-acetyltransferase